MPTPARARRWVSYVLSSPAAIAPLAACYAVAGIAFVLTDYTLNNEGLLTHYWASWARQDFFAVLFYQKIKPVLCVLYAPITGLGSRATLIAHVVVAMTAIPLLAATARSLGYHLANLPALIVALSPFYFFGGAAGFSNVDGVVGITAVWYLVCARRAPFLAGVVAGLLPWVRFELATFVAIMALYALFSQRDRALLLGVVVFPLLYGGGGALYHGDLLWMQHFPPSVPQDPNNPIYGGQHIGLRFFLEPAVVLTPAAALIAALPLRGLRPFEVAVLVYAVVTAVTMNVFPILGLGNFGSSQRYSLHLLPAFALLAARAVDPWWQNERPHRTALIATVLLAAWVATRQTDAVTPPLLIATYVVLLAAAWWRAGTVVASIAACLAALGLLLPLRIEAPRDITAPYLTPMIAWLDAHPDVRQGVVYTNAQLLAPGLERRGSVENIYHVAGKDMVRELIELTNPDNGQRERIAHLCATDLYGKTLLTPLTPDDVARGGVLVLRNDPRLSLLLPDALWSDRVEVMADEPLFRVLRPRPPAGTAPNSPFEKGGQGDLIE